MTANFHAGISNCGGSMAHTGCGCSSSSRNEAATPDLMNHDRAPSMISKLGWPDLEAPGLEEPLAQHRAITRQLAEFPHEDENKVLEAMAVAWQLHDGQVRKSTNIPYITHPLSNLQRLLDYGVTDPDVLSAAALHDCVEDCSDVYSSACGANVSNETEARAVTQTAIDETFGTATGDIVAAVSNELSTAEGLSVEEKNARYVAHAREQISTNFGAFMVKYSDFLDNAGSLKDAQFDDPKRKQKLARKYAPLAHAFREAAAEHEGRGDMALSVEGQAELGRELDRIDSELASILND